MTNEAKLSHLLTCGVGERTAITVATELTRTPPVEAIAAWVSSPRTFALLVGEAGAGKTIAAASALLNAKVRWTNDDGTTAESFDSRGGRFVFIDDLCRRSYYDDETARILGRLAETRWLVLDDLGAEVCTEPWLATLYSLINKRAEARRRTVLTANISVDAFLARYGSRITDRIRGDGLVVECGAASLRKNS